MTEATPHDTQLALEDLARAALLAEGMMRTLASDLRALGHAGRADRQRILEVPVREVHE